MRNLLYAVMLLVPGMCLPARAEEVAPPPKTPSYDVIRLRAGAVLAGNIIGYSADSILMKVFGVERAYKVAGIEGMKTANTDPDFLWTILGAALKSNNVPLAVNIAQRDKGLAKMVLGYPQFQETLDEYRRAGAALDKLLPAQAQTGESRDRTQRRIKELDADILESQQIIANPYYYETATVTRSVTCPTCGGTGVIRWVTINPMRRPDTDRRSETEVRRCPNCLGIGQISVSSVEEVQRRKDTNAEAAKIIGWRAERDKLVQALAGFDKQLASSDQGISSARATLSGAEARFTELCLAMARSYFPE